MKQFAAECAFVIAVLFAALVLVALTGLAGCTTLHGNADPQTQEECRIRAGAEPGTRLPACAHLPETLF